MKIVSVSGNVEVFVLLTTHFTDVYTFGNVQSSLRSSRDLACSFHPL